MEDTRKLGDFGIFMAETLDPIGILHEFFLRGPNIIGVYYTSPVVDMEIRAFQTFNMGQLGITELSDLETHEYTSKIYCFPLSGSRGDFVSRVSEIPSVEYTTAIGLQQLFVEQVLASVTYVGSICNNFCNPAVRTDLIDNYLRDLTQQISPVMLVNENPIDTETYFSAYFQYREKFRSFFDDFGRLFVLSPEFRRNFQVCVENRRVSESSEFIVKAYNDIIRDMLDIYEETLESSIINTYKIRDQVQLCDKISQEGNLRFGQKLYAKEIISQPKTTQAKFSVSPYTLSDLTSTTTRGAIRGLRELYTSLLGNSTSLDMDKFKSYLDILCDKADIYKPASLPTISKTIVIYRGTPVTEAETETLILGNTLRISPDTDISELDPGMLQDLLVFLNGESIDFDPLRKKIFQQLSTQK